MIPSTSATSATGAVASPALQVLRISASPRGAQSESLRLSQQILEALAARSAQNGDPAIALTELDTNLLAPVDAAYAATLAAREDPATPPASGGALHSSDVLIAQLDAADVVVIATPMHNFTVPSTLKAWVDHIVRVRATFAITPQGKTGTLRDRPVYVAVSSGGFISGERARHPDFLQPYLRVALATVGLHDVQFFSVEGTALGDAALERARAGASRSCGGVGRLIGLPWVALQGRGFPQAVQMASVGGPWRAPAISALSIAGAGGGLVVPVCALDG